MIGVVMGEWGGQRVIRAVMGDWVVMGEWDGQRVNGVVRGD